MADPRSTLNRLLKDLPELEQALQNVQHHSVASKRRISAQRKLDDRLKRIEEVKGLIARHDMLNSAPTSLNPGDESESDLSEVEETPSSATPRRESSELSAAKNVIENSEATSSSPTNQDTNEELEAISPPAANQVGTLPGEFVANIQNLEAISSSPTNQATNEGLKAISLPPVHQPEVVKSLEEFAVTGITENTKVTSTSDESSKRESVNISSEIDTKEANSHGPTPEQLAMIADMYPEPANDYDIHELVERFTDDDTIYKYYGDKFAQCPPLNFEEIPLKVLHAFPSFEDISVKAVLNSDNRWDELRGSDKICLSLLGRVAIRRFVEAHKTDHNATIGPNWIKVLARAEPRFLPEAATTSAPVALAFLRMQNLPEIRCRFHHNERHDERSVPDTNTKLTGCAFPPPETGEKKPKGKGKGKTAIQNAPSRKEGHLDCGCAVVDALEDWFHYKTARLFSTNPRIQNAFPVQGVIPTVERASLLSAFRSPIHIPLRLRYTGVNEWPDLAGFWMPMGYKLRLLRRCRAFIASRIQDLETAEASGSVEAQQLLATIQPLESTGAQHNASQNMETMEDVSGNVQPEQADDPVVGAKRVLEDGDFNSQTKKAKAE